MKLTSQSCCDRLAWLMAAAIFICRICDGAVTLPEETFDSPKQLQATLLDIHQQSYDSAVERMQAMLDKHGAELSRTDDDELMAVNQVFDTLPSGDRAEMEKSSDAKFGAIADQLLSTVRAKPGSRPLDFYAVAKRYPFTHTARAAVADAFDRAVEQGDLFSARAFHVFAVDHDWPIGPTEGAAMTALNKPTSPDGAFAAAGPLPFDAPWYNLSTGFESAKLFPVGSGDLAFVAGEHSVLALKSDGIVGWRHQTPPPTEPHAISFQPSPTGRGRLSIPAMLTDTNGRAMIVVVCQPVPAHQASCLTALRASDGKLLWSTNADPVLKSTAFLGSPAVAGRYVVAVGIETAREDTNAATLQLLAIDIMTGHPLWKTQLASLSVNQQGGRDLNLYLDQSPPAIVDGSVFVSPNIGAVFSIDLFDGQIRWMRPYRQALIGDGAVRKFNDHRNRGRDLIAPLAWTDLLRWHCTPSIAGNVIVDAPQDTTAAMGLDVATGKLLWESGSLPQATPIGVTTGKLILSGASLTAIDPATGLKTWTFTPVPGVRLTGPAVIRTNEILIRSTAGLLSVSPADGSSKPSDQTIDFHPAAASQAGKAALAGDEINALFGTSAR